MKRDIVHILTEPQDPTYRSELPNGFWMPRRTADYLFERLQHDDSCEPFKRLYDACSVAAFKNNADPRSANPPEYWKTNYLNRIEQLYRNLCEQCVSLQL